MTRQLRRILQSLGVIGAVFACSRTVVDPLPNATLFGTVTGPGLTPVEGVEVTVHAEAGATCAAPGTLIASDTTDTLGDYFVFIGVFGQDFDACVRLIVIPPAGSGLQSDTVDRSDVRFRNSNGDSVRVDVQLQP